MPSVLLDNPYFWIAVFILALGVLLWSSRIFTSAADRIGVFFGIPPFIVGVTIVALGTSLPELISSVIAVTSGYSEIVAGNVVGSNITNLCLVIGVSAVVGKRLTTTYNLIRVDLPLFFGSAVLFSFMAWDGSFNLIEGLLCLAGITIYIVYTVNIERDIVHAVNEDGTPRRLGLREPAVLLLSAVFIYIGARYTVDSVVRLSEIFDVGKELIAITAVAIGTSLPELVVSLSAARQGKSDIAIGNVLGSNIFNAFAVMGVSSMFGTVLIPRTIIDFSLPLMMGVTLMFVFISLDRVVTRWEGWLFLLTYVYFLGHVLNLF